MQGRTQDRRPLRLARGLGWFSLGLGLLQTAAPRRFARAIGLHGNGRAPALVRLVGLRELAAAAGLLAGGRRGAWLRARVAGDAMDLALLGAALPGARRRGRVGAALAGVAGIAVPDAVAARAHDGETEEGPMEVRTAITVVEPRDAVYAFWRDLEGFPRFMAHVESVEARDETTSHWRVKSPTGTVEWDAEIVEDVPGERIAWRSLPGADVDTSGTVRFVEAPHDRGTEVHLELRYDAPAGRVGTLVAKLLGEEPTQQAKDDLRRFKQVLETGEIARSDATPDGINAARLLRQRPAQPLEEVRAR